MVDVPIARGGRALSGWSTRLWPRALYGLALLAAAYPIVLNNGFDLDIATDMALWGVLALGLNAVLGWAGLLDLGYIAFFALGGYTYAILSSQHIMTFWPSLVVGMGISAAAAVVIGIPTLRLHSDYLAIMTLGFGIIVYDAAENLSVTGGDNGLFSYAAPRIGSVVLETPMGYYLASLVLVAIALVATTWVRRSRLGRTWLLVRSDETAAASVGVSVWRYKLYAYIFGSVWGSLAGALYAAKETIISPVSFSFTESFFVVAAVIIGGTGSIAACLAGGVVYIFISEAISGVSASLSGVIFAGAMLAVILLRPRGVIPARPRTRGRARTLGTGNSLGKGGTLVTGHVLRTGEALGTGGALRTGGWRAVLGRRLGRRGSVLGRGSAAAAAAIGPAVDGGRPGAGARLVAEHVAVSFGGVNAVVDVSLECQAGSCTAMIGANGAGKSTVLNAISGLVGTKGGRIVLTWAAGSHDFTGQSTRFRTNWGIGRTFQTPRLSRDLTVWENVLQGTVAAVGRREVEGASLGLGGRRWLDAKALANSTLELVGISGIADRVAGDLAYGDQRRCEIARVLAGTPLFILMDEPSSGMNDVETESMGQLLRGLVDSGIGILIVEHDMNVVRSVADRVLALDLGSVICEGPVDHVLSDALVKSRFLGES